MVDSILQDSNLAAFAHWALGPGLSFQFNLFRSLAKWDKRTPLYDGLKILEDYGIEVQIDNERRAVKMDDNNFSE